MEENRLHFTKAGQIISEPAEADIALLILPGLGFNRAGRKAVLKSGSDFLSAGIDVYLSPTVHRLGTAAALDRIKKFINDCNLRNYNRLYIFSYIAGWLIINPILPELNLKNLKGLILDRSPTQERAPTIARQKLSCLVRLLFGRMVFDIAELSYQDPMSTVPVSLLIETKPTSFIRFFKKSTLALGPLQYDPQKMGRSPDDHAYVHLDHLEMYSQFEQLTQDLIHFIQYGHFRKQANRRAPQSSPL